MIDDSIQLQSPEAIALNGLLSDLEFKASQYESMSDQYYAHWHGSESVIKDSTLDSRTACAIYANKAQDIRDLVNKWKPNKK